MDSLLANYASSDEEQEHDENSTQQTHKSSNTSSTNPKSSFAKSFFSSLPPPKSNQVQNPNSQVSQNPDLISSKSRQDPESVSNSKPKAIDNGDEFPDPKGPGSNLPFSALPKAKTHKVSARDIVSSGRDAKVKNVVQFRPPVNPDLWRSNEDDDEDEDSDEEKERRKRREAENAKRSVGGGSVTSRMGMPAPKNSAVLGALPSSAGTGRRSILEADEPVSSSSVAKMEIKGSQGQEGYGNGDGYSDNAVGAQPLNPTLTNAYDVNYGDNTVGAGAGAETLNPSSSNAYDANYANYEESGDPNSTNVYDASYANYAGYENVGGDLTSYGPAPEDYANYGGYAGYESSEQYENKWIDRSGGVAGQQVYEAAVESVFKVPGKRGRNEIPQEVIEVKQDELMKNRPREDQAKVTGIAFGPSYQPVSTKGKPTKLHKRKHQIGSLYFDMRQKETELAERRSKGFLTKAETHAKYGW